MNKFFGLLCEVVLCMYYVCLVFGERSINNKDLAFLIVLGSLSIINYLKVKKL